MKNKILSIVFLTISIVFSISMSKSHKYFEGEIHYNIDYTIQDNRLTKERLKQSPGAKMIMLFRNGNWLKKYYDTDGKLISVRYLDLADKKSYSWESNAEYIHWVDITKNDSPTSFAIRGKATVLGEACTKVTSLTKIDFSGLNFKAKAEYYYSNRLKTNRNWYKDFAEGNLNEITSQLNCIILKNSSDAYYYTVHNQATKIIEREITDKEFKFDKTRLPLKEL